jgi:hypothetical protein
MGKNRKLISVFIIVVAITVALLLPGICKAGSLEPPSNAVDQSGNPVATMKTLDQIPPTWSQKLPCDTTTNCPRFEVLTDFNSEAVLDKETGLVWERSPKSASTDPKRTWFEAQSDCLTRTVGGRLGWRLPTVQELASLVDPMGPPFDKRPSGSPFTNIRGFYWSSTTDMKDDTRALDVGFYCNACVGDYWYKSAAGRDVWCVRGGQAGSDSQPDAIY